MVSPIERKSTSLLLPRGFLHKLTPGVSSDGDATDLPRLGGGVIVAVAMRADKWIQLVVDWLAGGGTACTSRRSERHFASIVAAVSTQLGSRDLPVGRTLSVCRTLSIRGALRSKSLEGLEYAALAE